MHGVSQSLRLSEIGTNRHCRVLALLASTVMKPRSRSISFQSSRCNSAVRRPAKAPRARNGQWPQSLIRLRQQGGNILRRKDGDRGFRLLVSHHGRERTSALDQITPALNPIATGHENNLHPIPGLGSKRKTTTEPSIQFRRPQIRERLARKRFPQITHRLAALAHIMS